MRLKIPNLNDRQSNNKAVTGLAIIVSAGLIIYALVASQMKQEYNVNQIQIDQTAKVQITPDGFVPATIKILPGSQVTWINADNKTHKIAANPHPTHSDLSELESPELVPGASYTYKYGQKGIFGYHDHLDITKTGIVIVE